MATYIITIHKSTDGGRLKPGHYFVRNAKEHGPYPSIAQAEHHAQGHVMNIPPLRASRLQAVRDTGSPPSRWWAVGFGVAGAAIVTWGLVVWATS